MGISITGILIIGLLIICSIILLCFGIANENYIKRAKEESIGEKYIAVVLTNKSSRDEEFIYPSGIMFLIKHLERSKKPYKIMKRFDFNKFKNFVYDVNCRGLYIIGHGTRHSLKIDKREILEYSLFKGYNSPPKDFVVQLHCNHDGGESLADIIAPNTPNSFVSDSYRHIADNLLYFIRLDQSSVKMSVPLAVVILASAVLAGIGRPIFAFWMSLRNLPKRFLNMKEVDKKLKPYETCN